VGEAVQARANQLNALISRMFTSSAPRVQFVGALELIEACRHTRTFSIELPFLECLWRGDQYVLLCSLREYWKFASDDTGSVKRYLLESNVRDSLGLNAVNEDILTTLRNPGPSDFWWMNNGITILATRASVAGKSLSIDDVQIVNGLQTTETLAQYFREGGHDPGRAVLVKVIVSDDATARDEIIKATNNQTSIEHASLRATDKVQRDIEDVFERNGVFHYERRKNYHLNQGVDPAHVVSPLYVASGFVSLILKSPQVASRLRQRFMLGAEAYRRVFASDVPLDVWPAIVRVLKTVDTVLERSRPRGMQAFGFLRGWRQLVGLLAVARLDGKFSFSDKDLVQCAPEESLVEECWAFVQYHRTIEGRLSRGFTRAFARKVAVAAAAKFDIRDAEVVERKHPFAISGLIRMDDEFIDLVDKHLPEQPWPMGIHRTVGDQLRCAPSRVSQAIEHLMSSGRRHKQRNGIVYDDDGRVLSFDPSRVDEEDVPDQIVE
jgi:hypothetical protein